MFSWLFSHPLPPGTPAPDFTVVDQDGNSVTLSQFRGKNVVLIFYPRDGTPVCRTQLCEFRDNSDLTSTRNTIVFGINGQNERSHEQFRTRQRLNFPLLVDKDGTVRDAYRTNGLVTRRTVYLVGPDGTILYSARGKPAPAEVLAKAVV